MPPWPPLQLEEAPRCPDLRAAPNPGTQKASCSKERPVLHPLRVSVSLPHHRTLLPNPGSVSKESSRGCRWGICLDQGADLATEQPVPLPAARHGGDARHEATQKAPVRRHLRELRTPQGRPALGTASSAPLRAGTGREKGSN